jgi:hypothetical protein
LSIGEVMSLHPRKDTTRNRVCKHALVFVSQVVYLVLLVMPKLYWTFAE